MTVAPGPFVEHFNVIEYIPPCKIPGFVDPLSDTFFFQCTEELFGHRIILAISTLAHGQSQVIDQAEAMPVVTTILATLIAMYDDLAVRSWTPGGHHQRVENQLT